MKAKSNTTDKELVENKDVFIGSNTIPSVTVTTLADGGGTYGYEGDNPCWNWICPEDGWYFFKLSVSFDGDKGFNLSSVNNPWCRYTLYNYSPSSNTTNLIAYFEPNSYTNGNVSRTNIFFNTEISTLRHFSKDDRVYPRIQTTAAGVPVRVWGWVVQLKKD